MTSGSSTITPSGRCVALAMCPNRILGPISTTRDILDANRRPIFCRQDGLFDILQVAVEPEGADVHLLQARLDKAAAGIDVVDWLVVAPPGRCSIRTK